MNCFIGNSSGIGIKIFSDCITIANSDSVGSAFFHKYSFVASDHVTQLKRNGLDKYAYLFMLPIISRLSEKYSFNREINDERIKREKLMLPINDDGDIDFAFMSAFMRDVEKDILGTTLRTFENRLNVNESKMEGDGRITSCVICSLFLSLENRKDLTTSKNQIVVLAILVQLIKIMVCCALLNLTLMPYKKGIVLRLFVMVRGQWDIPYIKLKILLPLQT